MLVEVVSVDRICIEGLSATFIRSARLADVRVTRPRTARVLATLRVDKIRRRPSRSIQPFTANDPLSADR